MPGPGFMESRIGADFSSVRTHTDRDADALNRSIGAQAFTAGSNVAFSGGGGGGDALLGHELAHVVQQGRPSAAASTAALGHWAE